MHLTTRGDSPFARSCGYLGRSLYALAIAETIGW